ncbi:MAG: T9SS type A sorting domain-containing protein [Candidatus Delongbacteria bacterium]|nr:T9SS type A sorting domain-containing protein [Candidatus Delongbacteria bacterium]
MDYLIAEAAKCCKRSRIPSGLFIPCFLLVLVSQTTATVIEVPGDQATIQQGIDASIDGDTVLVAPGAYHEHINFNGHNILLTSSDGPEVTIIDGDSVATVVNFVSGESNNAVISGFTIQHGLADSTHSAGGITCLGASPQIRNNIIRDNSGRTTHEHHYREACVGGICADQFAMLEGNIVENNSGQGVILWGGGLIRGNIIHHNVFVIDSLGIVRGMGLRASGDSISIVDNDVSFNECWFDNTTWACFGVGVYVVVSGYLEISGNHISYNHAHPLPDTNPPDEGAGLYVSYGGNDTLRILNNDIIGNTGTRWAGGLYISTADPMIIRGNNFVGNSARHGVGGLYCRQNYGPRRMILEQNTFIENSAPYDAAMYVDEVDLLMRNNMFAGNSASDELLSAYYWSSGVMENNVFFENEVPLLLETGSAMGLFNNVFLGNTSDNLVSYDSDFGCNLLWNNSCGDEVPENCNDIGGNIAADPLFCEPDSLDFRLQPGSPCWPSVECGLIGAFDVDCDGQDVQNLTLPCGITLSQNYPNPFNPVTTIEYSLPYPQNVQLTVYNILGQQVQLLTDQTYSAGVHQVQFNGSSLSSGVYIYRLTAGDQVLTRKMILVQ